MGNPESLKMLRFPCIFHDFLNGEGNVGESLQTHRFHHIFHDFLNGEGSVGNPESCLDFHALFMISLMEKEAWETQKH